ncbi:MAG TPA: 2-oxo-4-hydroxy-4-carboxy-5-ureidoimidazoline decarboxylase [Amaricoccus sp.]|uniref:2-oxo-4-hydroxy-4-carboxy-5-ureidoimidazoline decarboxylase n=1 Tax=Amaricoccus sp. TaxID=1872485 RepID=UPI001DEFC586|nr:2-oxo-4-hydroxy-4-carboxy-5-ureidoimidazoline decarboxylase [Amaricoccus sp.]MCB1374485.1 2-oxo-4-hydroxy-4-carboxy-5-ureidoimidazoline decarboxylase [Paracoccaceae bacterium]MCC0068165.1 2-oxo-4-hydroxy-4-carboxy-5-ureidoimidazoline decarboxylase [Rhodovulum sp.]MCB1401633.1 2-oxo-4-hydroxy-4-carboxy-5-ureidoimidazoline decarboxylase [Paracoccaceae bacterium]HPG21242.1 2-oxo-4-hydroxy-4-carboxy-5-ureidoimidazoline decarboxylase [Amaricoccus sp.]HRW14330.1 2-oxo-4-hydroxy-4-carboxy-5-ureido
MARNRIRPYAVREGNRRNVTMGKLSDLNQADHDEAIAIVSPLIERAPQIAAKVAARRPFRTAEDLSHAISAELRELDEAARVALFRAHPELAPDNPLAMTAESQAEQGRLNLTARDTEHREDLAELNARYNDKYGFPFITALVRHKDMESVLQEFRTRLANDRESELEAAIGQITAVSAARVQAAFGSDDA